MRSLLVMAAVLLALPACYNAPDAASSTSGGPAQLAGAPAASFEVARTDGRTDSLAAHRGHVVLLNIWATWCPPCREEMPALQRFAREYAGRVVVLGVDEGEAASVAAQFAKDRGVTFPILIDLGQQYGRTYAAVGLPTTVIVGRDGHIVKGIDGPLSLEGMRAAVAPALVRK